MLGPIVSSLTGPRACAQAMPAHSLVLRPNGAEACSLILEYHVPSVPNRAPLLVVDIESPRVLALLRYENDCFTCLLAVKGCCPRAAGLRSSHTCWQQASHCRIPDVSRLPMPCNGLSLL